MSTLPAARSPHLVLQELADASAHGVESFSPFCLKVHRALRAAGLPYERAHAARPGQHNGPTGQVPVLKVDGRTIADSTAIVAWIAETRPDALETGPAHRTWEELADTALNGFLVASRWADEENWAAVSAAYFGGMPAALRWVVPGRLRAGVVRNLVARDVWRAGPAACWARLEGLLDDLDAQAPAAGFWLGERLGVADVSLFGQLRSLMTPLTPRQGAAVERRAALRAWIARVEAVTRGC